MTASGWVTITQLTLVYELTATFDQTKSIHRLSVTTLPEKVQWEGSAVLFPPTSLDSLQVSPLGVVPKKGTNKWRLILDLSSPEGHSVNDGIPPDLCSLSYISVEDAARAVIKAGRGALLAKVDIKSAYRIVEVHPEDRLLLGMMFDDLLFVDSVLPFGLRSTPKSLRP